jgi:aminodeoxyfutalosine deaminase
VTRPGGGLEARRLAPQPPKDADLNKFIAALPKAELHVHHVGSASARIVGELAERHPGAVPSDPEELRAFFAFRDFAPFVDVYLSVVDLLRTAEDVRYLTYEVAREMAEGQRIRYAELTCTPYTSVLRGIAIEAYTEAIEDARVAAERDFGLVLRWIYDIPGESGVPSADATLDYALDHGVDALVGFGLGGPEIGVPRAQFQPHFEAARAAGLHSVPHAGETTGPETIWDSLRLLGAERIGHGTSAALDPALLDHLAETGIPLEVCPSSNVATRAVASLAEHPLQAFVDAGVTVTINSDDPPMFGTTLNEEYAVAADLLGLDEVGVAELARAAVRASYAPDDVKTRVLGEIDASVDDWVKA